MDIEEIIRRAQSEGRFKDLPGKGKPLDLSKRDQPDIVSGLMKEAGYAPPWVELGKELDASEDAAERLKGNWRSRREGYLRQAEELLRRGDRAGAERFLLELREERNRVARSFAERWILDRRTTQDYNLLAPGSHQQRIVPNPDKLLRAFLAEFPDAVPSADDPPQVVERPARDDVEVMLEAAQANLDRKAGEARPKMQSERAEALIGFKSRFMRLR